MDVTDYNIIEILQKNGRISMKELGEMVALSPPAVAERVKRLEEDDIITGYKAVINKKKLGKNIDMFINVAMRVDKQEKFLNLVRENDNLIECYHVTGPYCMIVKANLSDMADLEGLIGKLQVFGDTQTYIILSNPIENKILKPSKKLREKT